MYKKILLLLILASAETVMASVPLEMELAWSKILFKVLEGKDGAREYCRGDESIELKSGIISKRTRYFKAPDPTKVMQEENVEFDLRTLRVRDYEFRNHLTGERVDLKMPEPPVANIDYTGPSIPGKQPDRGVTKWSWTSDTILGKTLHHFMVRQWESLLAGKRPEFDLLVPMKRASYGFQIRQGLVYKTPNGAERRVIHLEPSNWAIRQFVPEMAFHYEAYEGVPRLVMYEGASTIAIDGVENKPVRIEFEYLK